MTRPGAPPAPTARAATPFPRYMDMAGANPRGDHAIHLLDRARALTPEGLRRIAYDPWMPFFDDAIRPLAPALARFDTPRDRQSRPSARSGCWSAGTGAGPPIPRRPRWPVSGARRCGRWPGAQRPRHGNMWEAMRASARSDQAGDARPRARPARARLGRWRVRLGRGQPLPAQRRARSSRPSTTRRPSIPVPFASARWGSLASFGARAYPGTRRWYGTSGNSFVAIVEFGPRVRAWAVTAGGESGDPASPHFNDQAERYAVGRSAPGLFLPRRARGPCRAQLPSRPAPRLSLIRDRRR